MARLAFLATTPRGVGSLSALGNVGDGFAERSHSDTSVSGGGRQCPGKVSAIKVILRDQAVKVGVIPVPGAKVT